jgi:hypothetical protein
MALCPLNRVDALGMEHLYLGMDELLARDAAFFPDHFAGLLTKRVLSRYELDRRLVPQHFLDERDNQLRWPASAGQAYP